MNRLCSRFRVNMVCLFSAILTILTFQIVLCSNSRPQFKMQTTLAVDYFENCDGKEYPINYHRFSFRRNGSFVHINGQEIVSRDIEHPIASQNRIEKCRDKSNPDTCEYYTTWKWDDVCVFFNVFPLFKEYIDAHRPPYACPMKKNHYYVENLKVKPDMMLPFLGSGGNRALWKFRVTMTEAGSNEMVACVDMGLKVVAIRVRI